MAEFAGIADDSFQVLPCPPSASALRSGYAGICVMAACRVRLT